MRRRVSLAIPASAVAAALVAFACSSSTSGNSCGSGTAPSLIGTYSLVSYTISGTTVTTAQGAVGALRFYASLYGVNLTIPGAGAPTVVNDSGSYSVTGATCISQNSVMGQPTFTGTFNLSSTAAGGVLTVSGSAAGQPVASVWTKH